MSIQIFDVLGPSDSFDLPFYALVAVYTKEDIAAKMKKKVMFFAESYSTINNTMASQAMKKDDFSWSQFSPLIEIKVLRQDSKTMTALFKLAANAICPFHLHDIEEECFVTEGEVFLGGQLLFAGDYQIVGKGSSPGGCHSRNGAVILVRG
jgi:quercetin dioxygenase-like cupin family protein